MRRDQLEHAIRAATEIIQADAVIIIIGSRIMHMFARPVGIRCG